MSSENPPPGPPSDDSHGAGHPPPPPNYPPPPPANYPTPAEGSYPPPPPTYPPDGGGYPTPGYGGGEVAPVGVGPAFNWGWKKFTQNVGIILLGGLFYVVVVAAVQVIGSVFSGNDFNSFRYISWSVVFGIISFVAAAYLQAGIIRGSFQITNDQKPTLGTMFTGEHLGRCCWPACSSGSLVTIGFVLLIIPGLDRLVLHAVHVLVRRRSAACPLSTRSKPAPA